MGMDGQRVRSENPDRRFMVLFAIERGAKRFNDIWFDNEVRDLIHSRLTLSRYLKTLEKEGVITRNRVSHKHVEYEIAPGEHSSWTLAVHELGAYPFDTDMFQAILRNTPDKAIGLDIALNYAFNRFFDEEINNATAKIMGGKPQYRKILSGAMGLIHAPRERVDEDWSDDMITWHSRRYYMFLKNLRDLLLKEPESVKTYLRKRPWSPRPKENGTNDLKIVARILDEKHPHMPNALELKHALKQKQKQ